MKRIPPFGKPLAQLIEDGFRPNNSINLFIGMNAWQKGQNFSKSYPTRTLILPPWHSSLSYYWPVKDCDILIFDTGYAENKYVNELAAALYQHEAEIVRFIDPYDNFIVYHKE